MLGVKGQEDTNHAAALGHRKQRIEGSDVKVERSDIPYS